MASFPSMPAAAPAVALRPPAPAGMRRQAKASAAHRFKPEQARTTHIDAWPPEGRKAVETLTASR